jgi:hypothetical protein
MVPAQLTLVAGTQLMHVVLLLMHQLSKASCS